MAYVGKKPEPLYLGQVDDLNVQGDAAVTGNLTVTGTTITMDSASVQTVDLGDNDKIRLGDADDAQIYHDGTNTIINNDTGNIGITGSNVGIGTSSPVFTSGGGLQVHNDSVGRIRLTGGNSGTGTSNGTEFTHFNSDSYIWNYENGPMQFATNNTERMRIDSSGNLLVGKTSTGLAGAGAYITPVGSLVSTRDGNVGLFVNRLSSDGALIALYRQSTNFAEIGVDSTTIPYFIRAGSGGLGLSSSGGNPIILPYNSSANAADNIADLGALSYRFDDIYATNGTIQTSDRNEKQDIEELSEAEQRVAVAAKALLRKFRWKDAVAEKGDDARIHFGIIAQDLQAAFEAEGLDAGRYAMFISSTWWEHEVEVPAVEAKDAVLDEEGNVIEEAVEAQEAYTRTDTYDTAEEAPEGAVERTRLGVRYSELLAFIIAAL